MKKDKGLRKLHASLPSAVKRMAWNLKYSVLGYPQWPPPADTMRYLCERANSLSSILELGCGRGALLRGLREAGWTGHYCGVDISRKALDEALKKTDQRSTWVASDIESFTSPFKWDAIVLVESIYYVRRPNLQSVLCGLRGMLGDSGIILIRIHDLIEHREYVTGLYSVFPQLLSISPCLFVASK